MFEIVERFLSLLKYIFIALHFTLEEANYKIEWTVKID